MTPAEEINAQRDLLRADSRRIRDNLKTMRRRLEFIERELEAGRSPGATGWLKSERAALRWALDELEPAHAPRG